MKESLLISILLLLNCGLAASACHDIRPEGVQEIVAKKNELGPDKSYNWFDLHLSEEEHEVLETLHITTKVPFRMYGNPEYKERDIALYLESLGNYVEHSQRAAAIIHRFIVESFLASGFPAISVIIRPTEKTDKFDIPRWHFDSFPEGFVAQDMRTKIVCALKGPGTLLSSISGSARDEFCSARDKLCHDFDLDLQQKRMNNKTDERTFQQLRYQASFDIERRKNLDKLVAPYGISQAVTRQGALFIIGDPLLAAVHSEPIINEDRLFIAIISDTVEAISRLQRLEMGM